MEEDKNRGDRSEPSEYKTNGGIDGKKRESSSLSSLLPSSTAASQGKDVEDKETNLLNERTGIACEKKQEKDGEKGERRIGEIASGYGSMVMRTLRERTVVSPVRVGFKRRFFTLDRSMDENISPVKILMTGDVHLISLRNDSLAFSLLAFLGTARHVVLLLLSFFLCVGLPVSLDLSFLFASQSFSL